MKKRLQKYWFNKIQDSLITTFACIVAKSIAGAQTTLTI